MRHVVGIISLVLLLPFAAPAQKAPKFEVFGGYSYFLVRGYATEGGLFPPGSGSTQGASLAFPSFGLNGWDASVAFNVTRWLGAVADVGGQYGMPTESVGGMPVIIAMREHHFLFGPRFSSRNGRWTPFVHALFGGAHASVTIGAPEVLVPIGIVQTKFAMAVGGGVDVRVYRRFGVRLAQIDWLMTQFAGGRQQNLRVAGGLVIRL